VIPTSLLQGDNAAFIDDQWRRWLEDPTSVSAEWAEIFEADQREPVNGARIAPPPPDRRSIFGGAGSVDAAAALAAATRQARVAQMVNAYRVRGHFKASLDPLGRKAERKHPELSLAYYGLEDDLDTEVPTQPMFAMPPTARIGDIVQRLEEAYCGTIGAEFMNIDDHAEKMWVLEWLESIPPREVLNREEELRVLRKLTDAENFENLLHRRFPGTKRFSLEGAETLIPLLDVLITEGARKGVLEVVMGMAHRGRLNVLCNIFGKPAGVIVKEFEGQNGPTRGSGDVKYHLGYSSDVHTQDGHLIHLSLTPNPSHLEAVNPVVQGRTRAKQDRTGDAKGERSMGVLIHGDAAFIGQGSVAEALQLSGLDGYGTGGTIHVVVNNQIGFTTTPNESRSTPYATDMARMLAVPILHVNGEDPRAVAAAVKFAVAWRQEFHRDVVIDMYCYRKHGHNEGDEPSFTQPLMYKEIRRRPTPRANYAKRLNEIGYTTPEDAEQILLESRAKFDAEASEAEAQEPVRRVDVLGDKGIDPDIAFYKTAKTTELVNQATDGRISPLKGRWESFTDGQILDEVDTGFDADRLLSVLTAANTVPDGFTVHAKVKRIVAQRMDTVRGDRPVDWAVAEQAAFGTLVAEGYSVRLSGQDSARGTFSHRHAVWNDITTGEEFFPLQHVEDDQAPFWVLNSHLSEFAVLGFEYGYSLDTPDGLTLWEAQFGDFANGAQVIIDQFITSGEEKWGRLSNLVMLLPHGYEGQGPEHSSARLERYLLQCAQDNIQVANCSTPANLFHVLRRQVIRHVRKPLVLMTPKSLLRHPKCISTMAELSDGRFHKVIADPGVTDTSSVERVIFCSGRVYYDLIAELDKRDDRARFAIHRIELLYPFPAEEVAELVAASSDAEIVWCQEEPLNMGAWLLVSHWLHEALPGRTVRYAGRPAAASPATGYAPTHRQEQADLLAAALD
jgi:2-oxoglutarate dehydrogenase E1 component